MTATLTINVYTAQSRLACGLCTSYDERDAFGATVVTRHDVRRMRPLTVDKATTDCCGSPITYDADGYAVVVGDTDC